MNLYILCVPVYSHFFPLNIFDDTLQICWQLEAQGLTRFRDSAGHIQARSRTSRTPQMPCGPKMHSYSIESQAVRHFILTKCKDVDAERG